MTRRRGAEPPWLSPLPLTAAATRRSDSNAEDSNGETDVLVTEEGRVPVVERPRRRGRPCSVIFMHVGGCGSRKVACSGQATSPCPAEQNARTWIMGEPMPRLPHLVLLLVAAVLCHLPAVRCRTAPLRALPAFSHLTTEQDRHAPLLPDSRIATSHMGASRRGRDSPVSDLFSPLSAEDPYFLQRHRVFERRKQKNHQRHRWSDRQTVRPDQDSPPLPRQVSPSFSRDKEEQGSLTWTGPRLVRAQVTTVVPIAALGPFLLHPDLPLQQSLEKTLASRSMSSSGGTVRLHVVDVQVLDLNPENGTIAVTVRGSPRQVQHVLDSVAMPKAEVTSERTEEGASSSEAADGGGVGAGAAPRSHPRNRRSIRSLGISYGMNGRIRTHMQAHRLSISYRHVQPCTYADRFYCMNGGTCVFVGALDIKTCR